MKLDNEEEEFLLVHYLFALISNSWPQKLF
jgi:hypothetical protein